MITITVPLSDIPAFAARYGVALRRTGERSGLPVCEWAAEEQSAEQARAWQQLIQEKKRDGN